MRKRDMKNGWAAAKRRHQHQQTFPAAKRFHALLDFCKESACVLSPFSKAKRLVVTATPTLFRPPSSADHTLRPFAEQKRGGPENSLQLAATTQTSKHDDDEGIKSYLKKTEKVNL